MPDLFVPLDVNYQESDGILAVTPLAELLFIRSLCLSKRRFSDGAITYRQMQRLCDDLREMYPDEGDLASQLVTAGLLSHTDDGWQIVAWEKHNKTRSEVKSRGSKLNHERWHVKREVVDNSCAWCTDSDTDSDTDSVRNPIVETESVPPDSDTDPLLAESVFVQGTGDVPRYDPGEPATPEQMASNAAEVRALKAQRQAAHAGEAS